MDPVTLGLAGAGIVGNFLGGSEAAKAQNKATKYQLAATKRGIEEQRRRFDEAQRLQQPFLKAGQAQLDSLSGTAGAEGMGEQIAALLGSGGLDALINSRSQDARDQVFTQGLSRSGAGQMALSSVPTDTAMSIENMLRNRQQAIAGQGGTAGINLGNLGQLSSAANTAALTQQGQLNAANQLGQAQIRQGTINNMIGLGASALGAFDWGSLGGGGSGVDTSAFSTLPSGYATEGGGYSIFNR